MRLFYSASLLLLLVLAGCLSGGTEPAIDCPYGEHELWLDYGPGYSPEYYHFVKLNVIRYFKEVALGSEFGSDIRKVIKWRTRMKIFIGGDPDGELVNETYKVINDLNSLFTDGFSIEITSDSTESNLYLYFGNPEDYRELFPETGGLIENSDGLFTTYFGTDYVIHSGHIFVNTATTFPTLQKHILREELTQSIGLPNDLQYDKYSIFYNGDSNITEYHELDIETIRLLYHPKMIPGIGDQSVTSLLEDILCI